MTIDAVSFSDSRRSDYAAINFSHLLPCSAVKILSRCDLPWIWFSWPGARLLRPA